MRYLNGTKHRRMMGRGICFVRNAPKLSCAMATGQAGSEKCPLLVLQVLTPSLRGYGSVRHIRRQAVVRSTRQLRIESTL